MRTGLRFVVAGRQIIIPLALTDLHKLENSKASQRGDDAVDVDELALELCTVKNMAEVFTTVLEFLPKMREKSHGSCT